MHLETARCTYPSRLKGVPNRAPLIFRPFTARDFARFLKRSVPTYAREIAKARGLSRVEAQRLSKKDFKQLLPNGLATPNNFLWVLVADDLGQDIGTLWIACSGAGARRKAFIYDIRLEARFRDRGYGRQTLAALERWAKSRKVKSLGLNVFTHNPRAYHLYKSFGFKERSVQMAKSI